MAHRCRRFLVDTGFLVLAAVLALATTLTACSGNASPQIDYVVDGTLVTYNPNTVVGAASGLSGVDVPAPRPRPLPKPRI